MRGVYSGVGGAQGGGDENGSAAEIRRTMTCGPRQSSFTLRKNRDLTSPFLGAETPHA